MPGSSRPCHDAATLRQGWTLIELLLAVVIALLVITLLFSAYHTVLTATRGQGLRYHQDESTRVVQQLSRELQAAFLPEGDTNCIMRLVYEDGFQLAFCATLSGTQEHGTHWFDVTHLRYRTVSDGNGVTLVREAQPLVGPEASRPPVAHEQLGQVRELRVTLFDGNQWHTTWPVTDPPTLPRAARIELQSGTHANPVTIQTEIFVPGGSTIKPRSTPDR